MLKLGDVITNQNEILTETVKYYKKAQEDISLEEVDNYLSDIELDCTLSDEEKEKIDFQITIEECEHALEGMKSNKPRGPNGLPSDFFKKFFLF